MGNSVGNSFGPRPVAPILLEVKLSPIQADAPRGRNGLPCEFVARIGTLAGDAAAREVPWEEAVAVHLPSERSALLIALCARETGIDDPAQAEERMLTQVCLPYRGAGCLAELGVQPGGLPVPLQLLLTPGELRSSKESLQELVDALRAAREGVRPDRPCLSLSVRELAESRSIGASPRVLDDSSWSMPPARRQLVALELQNAALRHQRQKLVGPDAAGEDSSAQTSHARQLNLILEENEQIQFETARMREKLDRTKAVLADSEAQAKRAANPQRHDWAKTLSVMQHELDHCRERQQKIRANYEERVAGLQSQLQQAWQASPPREAAGVEVTFNPRKQSHVEVVEHEAAVMQARIKEAVLRRDDLVWEMNEARRKAEIARQQAQVPFTGPLSVADEGPEVQELRARGRRNEAELEGLRQELALQHERQLGSERQQGLGGSISQLYEELDECHRAREDERVRSESEVRELKLERDSLKDRVDDATSELQRLRSQSEALRAMWEQAQSSARPSAQDLDALRDENARKAQELERLRACEEERKQVIADLEREQEVLVEQTSLKAAPRPEGGTEEYMRSLVAKAQELKESLERAQASCKEYEEEAAHLRKAAQDAELAAKVLKKSHHALELSAGPRRPGTLSGTASGPQSPTSATSVTGAGL